MFSKREGKIGMSTIDDLVDFVEENGLDDYLLGYSLEGDQVAAFRFETYLIMVDMPLYEDNQEAHLTTIKEDDYDRDGNMVERNQKDVKTWKAIGNYFTKYGI